MFEFDTKKYTALNEFAEQNGIVIFGGSEDREIPLCELKQAFALESRLYNRSVSGLSITDAIRTYDACVAPLDPEIVLLHIGDADRLLFQENSAVFDQKYCELIAHIRSLNKNCRIAVISLKTPSAPDTSPACQPENTGNPTNDAVIREMNRHLQFIADSEHCEFSDITNRRVWNPKETRDVLSFLSTLGFVRPHSCKRPIYDLIKILFCYESAYA